MASILLPGCKAEPPPTALELGVETDLSVPNELDRIQVYVEGPGKGARRIADGPLHAGVSFPRTLVLLHSGGPLGPLHLRVEGRLGRALVVRREARLDLQAGRSLRLTLWLARACRGVECRSGRSCEAGTCIALDVPPEALLPSGAAPSAGNPHRLAPDAGDPGSAVGTRPAVTPASSASCLHGR